MDDIITNALGDQYAMFYHPRVSTRDLKPLQTLANCCQLINQEIDRSGTNIYSWNVSLQDEAARLMRINWIYQRLAQEPIRKPVLAHAEGQSLIVDCGDTRLCAVNALPDEQFVAALVTCRIDQVDQFQSWVRVYNKDDVLKITGFAKDAVLLVRTGWPKLAIEWMEIGDQSTSHHLHDVDLRVKMMQTWLELQTPDFRFTPQWVYETIDWEGLVSNAQNH